MDKSLIVPIGIIVYLLVGLTFALSIRSARRKKGKKISTGTFLTILFLYSGMFFSPYGINFDDPPKEDKA